LATHVISRYDDATNFVRGFVLTSAIVLVPLLLSVLFFIRSGENWSYFDVVAFQRTNDALFAPAASFDYFEYKLEMIRQVRPAIVVLGSSRGLGFQGQYFTVPFVNAALAMRSLEEGELFLEKILEVHKPLEIILCVDFWWFNRSVEPSGMSYGHFPRLTLTRDLALLPLDSVWKGKLASWQLPAVALLGYRRNALTRYDNLGVAGIANSNGIRADGSMLYAEYALGDRRDLDPRFSRTAGMIKAGLSNYAWGQEVDRDLFDRFEKIIFQLQKNGVHVALVLPPLAPSVGAMLATGGHYRYIDELRSMLRRLKTPFADFHDADSIPATDCEFIDGYHSGDVTYLKMLVKMAHNWPSLSPYVDLNAAERTISAFDGNIIDQSMRSRFRQIPEADFMQLECPRRISPNLHSAM
jgi:hypothetical protein